MGWFGKLKKNKIVRKLRQFDVKKFHTGMKEFGEVVSEEQRPSKKGSKIILFKIPPKKKIMPIDYDYWKSRRY